MGGENGNPCGAHAESGSGRGAIVLRRYCGGPVGSALVMV